MAKNLDGIKKLNSEEIKKNRKIVLDYIGDNDLASNKQPKATTLNKIDGIKSSGLFNPKLKAKDKLDELILKKDNRASKQKKINSGEEAIAQKKIAREELLKNKTTGQAGRIIKKKLEVEAAGRRQEESKITEKKKEEKRAATEKRFLAEIKKEEETKKIKQEIELSKREAKIRRKEKWLKMVSFFINNLKSKIGNLFSVVRKNFIYYLLYLIIFLIIAYLALCLLILRFKNNNTIIGELGRVLSVPMVITNQGVISYNDFNNIRKNNNYDGLNLVEKKNSLAKWLILKNLNRKYGLTADWLDKILIADFIRDEDYNKVGLSRIKKINELLINLDDIELLSKYADEYNEVIYYTKDEVIKKFGSVVLNLNSNQISNIIFRDNGYYIVQVVDNQNEQLGIKYLFVGAKTLDQYTNEKITEIKFFILAN